MIYINNENNNQQNIDLFTLFSIKEFADDYQPQKNEKIHAITYYNKSVQIKKLHVMIMHTLKPNGTQSRGLTLSFLKNQQILNDNFLVVLNAKVSYDDKRGSFFIWGSESIIFK